MRPLVWLTILGVVGTVSVPRVTAAQPVLRVRAETRIEVLADDGRLSGVLIDDAGNGLAGQSLTLIIGSVRDSDVESNRSRRRIRVQTDGAGKFDGPLELTLPVDVEAVFDGNDHFQRSEVVRRVEAVAISLSFVEPHESFDLDSPSHTIAVALEGPFAADHSLTLRNELGHELGQTNASDAETRWEVPSPMLGPIGAGTLRVTLEDGLERVLAEQELRVVRFRQPVLSIERHQAQEPEIRVRGTLSDSSGALRRRAISIFVDGTLIATTLSDTSGRFGWTGDLDSGSHTLEARFATDQVGHPSAVSERLEIALAGNWLAELWFLLPFGLFALFALWLVRARPATMSSIPERVVRGVSLRIPPPGRSRQSDEIGGQLLDLVDGMPKSGHIRAVSESDESREIVIPPSGEFRFPLPAGKWRLVFGSDGHAPEIIDLRSPHDGRYLQMSVRLENWRHRAVRILRRAARSILGRRDLSATTVHQLRQEPEIAEIAMDVEILAYGPGTRDGAAIGALEEKAEKIPGADDGTR